MAPDLPGFYFDAVRNRYFKIQPNYVAPAGSKYSRQAVEAEKVIMEARRWDESIQRSKAATTVTRSKILRHPLTRFDRSLGDVRKAASAILVDHYAASLEGSEAFDGHRNYKPSNVRTPVDSDDSFHLCLESGQFSIDHVTGTLYTDLAWCQKARINGPRYRGAFMSGLHRQADAFASEQYLDSNGRTGQDRWPIVGTPDDGGALYSPKAGLFDTVSRAMRVEHIRSIDSGLVLWTQSAFPEETFQGSVVKVGASPASPLSGRDDSALVNERVQDVAVRSSERSGLVALATSQELWMMDIIERCDIIAKYSLGDSVKDLMQITFKDHNILIGGTRSGKLLLYDIREPPSDMGGRSSAARVQHASGISALHALSDGDTILVSGLSSTSLYDLRYTPAPSLKCHLPRSNAYCYSPSILDFDIPSTHQQTQYGLGIAYDPELNILVRASTDNVRNHRVGIWNVRTGRLMKRSRLSEHRFGQPVICADIVRVRDGPKSILLSDSVRIYEWSAQGGDRDEDG